MLFNRSGDTQRYQLLRVKRGSNQSRWQSGGTLRVPELSRDGLLLAGDAPNKSKCLRERQTVTAARGERGLLLSEHNFLKSKSVFSSQIPEDPEISSFVCQQEEII